MSHEFVPCSGFWGSLSDGHPGIVPTSPGGCVRLELHVWPSLPVWVVGVSGSASPCSCGADGLGCAGHSERGSGSWGSQEWPSLVFTPPQDPAAPQEDCTATALGFVRNVAGRGSEPRRHVGLGEQGPEPSHLRRGRARRGTRWRNVAAGDGALARGQTWLISRGCCPSLALMWASVVGLETPELGVFAGGAAEWG